MISSMYIWSLHGFQKNDENQNEKKLTREETLEAFYNIEYSVLKIRKKCIEAKNFFEEKFKVLIEEYISTSSQKFFYKIYEYGEISIDKPVYTISKNIFFDSKRYFSLSHSSSKRHTQSSKYLSQDVYNYPLPGDTPIKVTLRKLFFTDLFFFVMNFSRKLT
ncbi:hypothetical protein CDIK_2121 [Cucumispora dikerogammari]|nr:hypothetical protein CDIK_2121 [Cucumispora dikerogammari]